MANLSISLVMNVYNEEQLIANAIKSAEGVDEIIVADMESTDDTVKIAESFGAKIITLPNSGFCESGRQLAIDAATSDWCLILDGDEELCAGGLEVIRQLITNQRSDVSAFLIPFHTYIGDRRIMATGWEADEFELHERVFRTKDVNWPTKIHGNATFTGEKCDLPEGYETKLFVRHQNFRDFSHLLEKFNRYTSTEANQIIESSGEASMVRGMRDGFAEIINRYSPEQDGELSLALCFAMLSYRINAQFKAAEKLDWISPDGVPSKSVMEQAVTIFWNALGHAWLQEQRSRLAEQLNTSGDVEEAMRELRRLLGLWGNEASLLCDLGSLEFTSGHADAALQHLEMSVQLKPDNLEAVQNLEAVRASLAANRVVRPQPRR